MKAYKLKKVKSIKFDLSESFSVLMREDYNSHDEEQPLVPAESVQKDDSLNVSYNEEDKSGELEEPLLSLNTDVKEIVEEFIHDSQHISDFYMREKNRIYTNFQKFYEKFTQKLNHSTIQFNLREDLKEHNLDGLGYSSSWARQFIEFYSKLSWLDGFAKINITAMQKLLLKFDKIIFQGQNNHFSTKLNCFVRELPLHFDKGCIEERQTIRRHVAEHYFKNDVDEAYQFLESSISQYQHEDSIPLTFLTGAVVALTAILVFFLCMPKASAYLKLNEVKEIYPIFRSTL